MNNYCKPMSPHACAAGWMLALVLSLASTLSTAHDYAVGDIEIVHPYAPPTPPGVAMAAGYLEIVNHGHQDDRLMGGKVDFARDVQIHQTVIENDVSRMRQITEGLVIPAGVSVQIEPTGIHLMFADLAEPLVDGERHVATLIFEKAGELKVEFAIEHPGSGTIGGKLQNEMPEGGMPMDGMKMEGMKH